MLNSRFDLKKRRTSRLCERGIPRPGRRGRLFRAVAVALGFALAVSAGTARAETLADALVSAYENSGLLEQNRALLRAADEDVAQAIARLRPIISWSADLTSSFGRSRGAGGTISTDATSANIGITGSLLLYDSGRSSFQLDAAKETVLATRQNLVSIEQQVLLRAVQAYMNLRRNSEFVSLRENNLRLLQQEVSAARDRFDVGEVTRTDVAQAEARLAAAQSGLALAQGDLQRSVEEFRAAIGRRPGNLQTPSERPQVPANMNEAQAVALRKHPDIRQAQRDVTTAELNVRAADAAMKPSVNLNARIGAGEELSGRNYDRTGSVGIEMTAPIYQGGGLSSAKRQAIAQRDAQRSALHLARIQVEQNVGNAYADLRATRAGREASREAVRAAEIAFRGVREEASLGARTTLEVLDAEQELLDARANLISAEVDVMISSYSILASMGELTAKALRLDVQTYDPAAYYNMVKDAPAVTSEQGRKLDRVLRAVGKE